MKRKDGVKILILSPDKVLLFHRDNIPTIPYPDCWHLIGGGIDEGETPEQALVREVKEEACYDLKYFKLITKLVGEFGEQVWFYIIIVNKEDESKFVHGVGEGQEIGWFTVNEALKLKLTNKTRELFEKFGSIEELKLLSQFTK
jgi:mutator protein MutT